MPAIKSSHCETKRLELGAFERKMLKKMVQAEAKNDTAQMVNNYAEAVNRLILPVSIAGVGVGIWYAGKFVGEGLAQVVPDFDGFGEMRDDGTRIGMWEIIAGKKEYTFNNNDGSTTTYHNPMGGIPVFGWIGGIGANLTAAAEAKATGIRD